MTIKLNVINEPKDAYTGGPSTLCQDAVTTRSTNVIVTATWENGINLIESPR